MRKVFLVIALTAVAAMSGCGMSAEEQSSINASISRSERESSSIEESISREAEIEEVDEWGVSLDDVDSLAKQAIRKHDNIVDYHSDYRKAVRVTDDYLEDIKEGKETEEDWADFLVNYKKSCEAGIEYLKASVDVKFFYELFTKDNDFNRQEKDAIRTHLTLGNRSIKVVEQSVTDMDDLLKPIIEEEREPSEDELEKVFDIYQVLIDIVYSTEKYN